MKREKNTEKVESILTKTLKRKADQKAHESGMSMATYINIFESCVLLALTASNG